MQRTFMGGGAGVFYYHFDGLGSVAALSNANGVIVEKYEYDVYGAVTIRDVNDQILTTGDYGNPYMFTGRRYDDETGNYYYRVRYYSPDVGRFLSLYPLGTFPEGGRLLFDPTMQYQDGMNLYGYVGNNPVNKVDPVGLKWRAVGNARWSLVNQWVQGLIDVPIWGGGQNSTIWTPWDYPVNTTTPSTELMQGLKCYCIWTSVQRCQERRCTTGGWENVGSPRKKYCGRETTYGKLRNAFADGGSNLVGPTGYYCPCGRPLYPAPKCCR